MQVADKTFSIQDIPVSVLSNASQLLDIFWATSQEKSDVHEAKAFVRKWSFYEDQIQLKKDALKFKP